ncbi:SDR family NAD(P)-dependent oxidoreductase [Saccharomonospora xinjiangensis]|uniref:SDR family NAD(P)-dependent oxidoreductase n=1 Tax=Saccharomonospora xinjiangensis TaxID=75294 RepID=UPI00106F33E1|nr:SDR family NAD(P)-dependent oxidoreductase [Saccharomonospora xinjiangensis]QBQ60736.1 3-oxoacyl-[acyl-carrier-protein] reductase FabG [Saccharomonospora xinjiangensis]
MQPQRDEATDLTGRVAVVTGALRGLGRETARGLIERGAHVVLAGRDAERGAAAVAELSTEDGTGGEASFEHLDTASLASAASCADRLAARLPGIDFLIANAGVMAVPFARSGDGVESQFATNYLGHFELIRRLLPTLLASGGGRVVTVTTSAPVLRPIRWDDPNFETGEYDPFEAYGQSKSAAVLHAAELHHRFAAEGLTAVSVAPGVAVTDLGKHLSRDQVKYLMSLVPRDPQSRRRMRPRTPAQGAEQILWAATSDEAAAGGFCEDFAVHERPREVGGPEAPARLWELSERMVASVLGDGVAG